MGNSCQSEYEACAEESYDTGESYANCQTNLANCILQDAENRPLFIFAAIFWVYVAYTIIGIVLVWGCCRQRSCCKNCPRVERNAAPPLWAKYFFPIHTAVYFDGCCAPASFGACFCGNLYTLFCWKPAVLDDQTQREVPFLVPLASPEESEV